MTISGFTFMRNTAKLYYPLVESINSILPLVDEFVIALGKGDGDDLTLELIESIESKKIKIIHTEWDSSKFPNGTEYAHQTDIARENCVGDWLFYLQSDEVLHEKFLSTIKSYCEKYLNDIMVDGFLFGYKHFFGDYFHFINDHGWYQQEIRIIRNQPDLRSWGDAQSFRKVKPNDFIHYRQKNKTRKLNVVRIPAEIYHYGWVRPPFLMQTKSRAMDKMYHDPNKVEDDYNKKSTNFDYGNLSRLNVFEETHPEVMGNFIRKFNWGHELNYTPDYKPQRVLMKHEKLKYRLLTFVEKHFLGGRHLFGYKNWKVIS
ncbi:MAG: hypothetical protein KA251_08000 [Saprospiraceae bacterium]|nr:hypothetical protein [Candidatus Vicinibacter affinis]MBP6522919.1 hypothetical protein [Saprospiraceae bacterium]MBK7301732.1 hypothetical protein [Candidatus Vicinibacter affinis]MBK7692871.1 hypothetical protein [Candidatus Vicinibacter affinis]MBK7797673.1 hypothetical protein [Candidatus Vicinibacter affinis]